MNFYFYADLDSVWVIWFSVFHGVKQTRLRGKRRFRILRTDPSENDLSPEANPPGTSDHGHSLR